MSNNLLSAAAGYYASLDTTSTYVEDVFSTYLYTGNGSGQTIANGIELSGQRDFSSALWGADAYVTTPNTGIDDFGTGPFTVELWLFHNSSVPDGNYATFFDNGGQRVFLSYGTGLDKLLFYSSSGQTNSTGFAHGMANNTWNHVAFVRDGTEGRIFVNGTRIGTETITNNYDLSGTGTTYINAYSGSFTGYNTNSYWSDFRVVKGYALYDADFDPPTEPLQVIPGTTLLMFQGGSGATTDHSGTRTLTLTGSVTTSTSKPVSGFTPEPGKGGLVWVKERTGSSTYHGLVDTERGNTKILYTNQTSAEVTTSGFPSFTANGFSVALDTSTIRNNDSGDDYVSWTFAKAPKFFDVVTYTGNGSTQTISHNLGSVPGCIIVKGLGNTYDWFVWHRSETGYGKLNDTSAWNSATTIWNDANPTSTEFYLNYPAGVNQNNFEYVAYLFAHNDGDGVFGENGNQDIIKCGSYSTTNVDKEVDLGFEPQWVLIKKTNGSSNYEGWNIFDNMRGVATGGNDPILLANESSAEDGTAYNPAYNYLDFTSTGFITKGNTNQTNGVNGEFIYIAIRRGPMKTPESGTEVFAIDDTGNSSSPTFTSGFPVDWALRRTSVTNTEEMASAARLTGTNYLLTPLTNAEASYSAILWDYMDGYNFNKSSNPIAYMFRRAPGFFDVVAYEGDGVAGRTVTHNLGVAPDLLIVKSRTNTRQWRTYVSSLGPTKYLELQSTAAAGTSTLPWNDTAPTATEFTLGSTTSGNASGIDYIAYLFATLPGVSKVGSFSHTIGSTTDVDCGFSSGARFVMLKRYNTTGNWVVMDTERGIVAGNDPYLSLNTTAAEVTTADVIDPLSSGFQVASGFLATGDWIFLAIA